MSAELTFNQKRELLEQALEVFGYDTEQRYPEDAAHEIVDRWLPVYYNRIRDAWIEAGCPEPEEMSTLKDARDIHHAMQLGLYEVAWQFLSEIALGAGVTTHGDAAEAIRDELAMTTEQRVERILAS